MFASVVANRLETVRYLLELKFKKLSDAECERIKAKDLSKNTIKDKKALRFVHRVCVKD